MSRESPGPTPNYELVIRPYSVISMRDLFEIWRYRELLWTLVSRDIRVRYKQAAFGIGWALVQPIVQMVIYTLVFNRLAKVQSDAPVSYPVFAFASVVIWGLFSGGLTQASNSLVEASRLIKKVYFPRVVIPLSAVFVVGVDFLIGFALLLIAMPFFGAEFHVSMLLAPVFAVLAAWCCFAIALWTSAINIQYRDVRYALPFFLQLLVFVTPVFYPSSMIPEEYRIFIDINPMAAVVDGFRAAMFGTAIPWERVGIAFAIVVVTSAAGFLYFRRMEHTFADRA